MSSENCGCKSSSPSPADTEYMMIKSTSMTANACGDPQEPTSATADCAKQEPEYDSILNSFLVPAFNNTTNIRVCNAAVYSIGQWLMFINPHVVMRITNINGNDISLINGCPNNVAIAENPDAGSTVNTGTRFYPVSQPPCSTASVEANKVYLAIQQADKLEMDNIIECTNTAIIQPTGIVQSDPGDAGWTPSLQRIFGFVFKGGTPVFSALKAAIVEADQANHRRLGINKVTKEVVPLSSYSESTGVQSGKQSALAISTAGEKVVGPAYFPCFFQNRITLENETSVIASFPKNFSKSYTISSPELTSAVKNQDHYYAMVRFSYFCEAAPNHATFYAYLNTQKVAYIYAKQDDNDPTNVFMPIRVDSATNQLILNFSNNLVLSDVSIGLEILGIYL